MADTLGKGSGAYEFVLIFYDKEPIISAIIAIIIPITPFAIAFLRFLNKKSQNQTENLKNIREHEFKMKKEGLK